MSDPVTTGSKRGSSRGENVSRAERARARWMGQDQQPSTARRGSVSPPPTAPPTEATRPRLSPAVVLLYPLVLISLGLNVLLIRQLLQARDMAFSSLDQVMAMTDEIESQVISIPIQIDQEFPVRVSVPFEYKATFPVNTEVPVKTTLFVPFDIMGETIELEVPVDMTIPVNVEVPVSLAKTFDISATVPVSFAMDVEFSLADTPIPDYLSALRSAVQEIKQ